MKKPAAKTYQHHQLLIILVGFGAAALFMLGTVFVANQAFAVEGSGVGSAAEKVLVTGNRNESNETGGGEVPPGPLSGWQTIDGTIYFYSPSTNTPVKGLQTIDGARYYFNENTGARETGWKEIGGARYYFEDGSGRMVSGWMALGGDWYYFNESNGQQVAGWLHWDNGWFYLSEDGSGRMRTGWQWLGWSAGASWFYFSSSGRMATGWQYIDHKWEFLTTVNGNWIRTGGPGRGTNYVEVDLSRQHMWYVRDGRVVVESDVVTGAPWGGRATPAGAFYIMGKQSPTVLRGPGYASPVSYWMPITSSGVGLHDATWQSAFGGTRYQNYGSHGCINMPLDKARELYTNCSTYDSVVVHW
jgi:hypothetical protein